MTGQRQAVAASLFQQVNNQKTGVKKVWRWQVSDITLRQQLLSSGTHPVFDCSQNIRSHVAPTFRQGEKKYEEGEEGGEEEVDRRQC